MLTESTVLSGATLVTMDGARRVFPAGEIRFEGTTITHLGNRVPKDGARVVDVSGHVVLPGFVQCHVHLCQTLFRNQADDLALLPWLKERIWPFEAAHDPVTLRTSADLGLAEMMCAGTTTILDMGTVHHQDAVFEAMENAGIRGASGKAMMDAGKDVPAGLSETTEASLSESIALSERWHGKGRLEYAFAPRFILSCSEALWRGVAKEARARNLRIHSHIAEHADEREAVRAILGKDDVAALFDYGIFGDHVLLAHGVQLTDAEMARLAEAKTRIVHCPSANLKLASGVANVPAMRRAGIVVGAGADGAPCNNRMDPWTELRSAALLAKVADDNAASLPAKEALELLTIEGARALCLDDRTGSLEVGKEADLQVVDMGGLHQAPFDPAAPYSALTYATTRSDVRHVFVAGEWIVENGVHQRVDQGALLTRVQSAQQTISKRTKSIHA